jgi:hypothetical protein
MRAKQHLQEEQIREALNTHWYASAAGDANEAFHGHAQAVDGRGLARNVR